MKFTAKKAGMLFGVGSGIAYGSYGIFSSLLLQAGVTDVSIALLPALALTVVFGIKTLFKWQSLKEIPWKYLFGMIFQGFFICNGMNYCYTQAYAHGMPIGIVAIVAFCNVIIVMVLSYFVFGYKFTFAKIAAIIFALIGVSLVIGLFDDSVSGITMAGLAWTGMIPILYGLNVTMNSYFLSKEFDSDAILFVTQLSALAFMLIFMIRPVAFCKNLFTALGHNPLYWAAFLGFCLIPQGITYGFMQESLKRIEATIYQILMALDPVTALVLGAIVFSQSVRMIQIIGICIVLATVLFINIIEGREETG